jgi:deoxyribose-phosphate aldolase
MTDTGQRDYALRALACLDLTSLNTDDTRQRIDELCNRALSPAPGIDLRPAAVCVYPRFVTQVRDRLAGSGIAVAAVANFPLGIASAGEVVNEVEQALADGADEIDVVFPYRGYMAGAEQTAADLVHRVSRVCRHGGRPARLKVILETGALGERAVIKAAAETAIANGADFLKTSTGKLEPGATLEAAEALLEVIAAAQQNTGRFVGLKVSGGVKSVAEASAYLDLADLYLKPDGAHPGNFRFGASGLLNEIVDALGHSHETRVSSEY